MRIKYKILPKIPKNFPLIPQAIPVPPLRVLPVAEASSELDGDQQADDSESASEGRYHRWSVTTFLTRTALGEGRFYAPPSGFSLELISQKRRAAVFGTA